MDIVYQVIERLSFYGETQDRIFGTYTTRELAEKRLKKVLRNVKTISKKHTSIHEIKLDVDVDG